LDLSGAGFASWACAIPVHNKIKPQIAINFRMMPPVRFEISNHGNRFCGDGRAQAQRRTSAHCVRVFGSGSF
jgi:hypothetical protein